jgi:hypothetical protein
MGFECGFGLVRMWRVSVLQMWRQAMATRGTACKAVNVVMHVSAGLHASCNYRSFTSSDMQYVIFFELL